MNRIGIFCFYDKDGIVDQYVEFLLQSLRYCLNNLVIVVNGKISDNGKIILEKYAEEIYIRENKGFDSGAYKDVIINLLGWDKVQEYDELVLCNDTFYGPFISFEAIFEKMRSKEADFWGLNYYYNQIANHIQSYFLVFRKNIIIRNDIKRYFDKNINICTDEIKVVYNEFEMGLFYYLVNQGYSFAAYSDNNPFDIYLSSNIGIKEFNLPILKKKAFAPENFRRNNTMDTLKYLNQNSNYNVNLILDNIKRIYNLEITKQEVEEFDTDGEDIEKIRYNVAKVSAEDIKDIILTEKKIYIYGLGIWSEKISKIIDIYHGKIEGYIISDDQVNISKSKNGIKVYRISEIDNMDDMVIIVALGKANGKEVAPYLKEYEEVIFLW